MKKILHIVILPIILVPGIYLAYVWNNLPKTIPVHFDLKGNADRYGSKNELLILVAVLSAVTGLVYLLLLNIHRIDPKKQAVENRDRLQRIGFAVAVFMSAIACIIIYSGAKGGSRFNMGLVFGAVGLLFAIIGNYMPNLKPNYFAGFRLPWTLENADNWRKTHALAGKLWFAGGLFLTAVCFLTPATIALILFFTVTIIIIIIPAVYSYRLYKKQKALNGVN